MTSPLVTVQPDTLLSAALTLMEQQRVHHLLVVVGGRMAGILSSADLLKLAFLQRHEESSNVTSDALGLRVRDVMQSHVAVVRENASLREIACALSLGGFHALPVLAIDDTPVGIVTSSDLVALLIDQIEAESPSESPQVPPAEESGGATMSLLLDVLRAAEIYLHSGQSGEQHSRLTRAVDRARERAAA